MSSNQQYEKIYNFLYSLKLSDDKLSELKNIYADIINSKRRLQGIRSVKDLLQVLQKRDHINPQKINTLIELAELFEGIPTELFSAESTTNNNTNGFNLTYGTHTLGNRGLPRLSTDLGQRVYQIIASDIGSKWTDFARALHVPEGYIDQLFYTERDCNNRVYEILRYHQERCDLRLWRSSLLDGLTEARRSDIKIKVQSVFDTYLP